jgi:hypothetical protein
MSIIFNSTDCHYVTLVSYNLKVSDCRHVYNNYYKLVKKILHAEFILSRV